MSGPPSPIRDQLVKLLILAPVLVMIPLDPYVPKRWSSTLWVENVMVVAVALVWVYVAIVPGGRMIDRVLGRWGRRGRGSGGSNRT
jgi:hypothetical protein